MSTWRQSFQGVVCAVGLFACGSVPVEGALPDAADIPDAPDGPDTTAPRVVQTMPASGAAAGDVNAPIRIMFDEALDAASVTAAAVAVTGPGATAVPATVTVDGRVV